MPTFPKLSTGVTAQYPCARSLRSPVRTLTFLDGNEQRFPAVRLRRKWQVDLSLLSEDEAARVCQFAGDHFDTLEPFSFADPVSGIEYPACVLETNQHWTKAEAERRHGTQLLIVEDIA